MDNKNKMIKKMIIKIAIAGLLMFKKILEGEAIPI